MTFFYKNQITLIIFDEVDNSILDENTSTHKTDDSRWEVPHFAVKSFRGRRGDFWIGGYDKRV